MTEKGIPKTNGLKPVCLVGCFMFTISHAFITFLSGHVIIIMGGGGRFVKSLETTALFQISTPALTPATRENKP